MRTILAAIDSSASRRPVINLATSMAKTLNACPEAFHVCEGGLQASFTAENLGAAYRLAEGDPLSQIVGRAAESDVVAVVVGAGGHPKTRILGHLARQIADLTEKPVLVVPRDAQPRDRIRRVVIAMEGTPAKARNLKVVFDLASPVDVDLVVIHVDDESTIPSFSDQVAHETEAYAHEFLARYLPRGPKPRLELRVGAPADEIIDLTEGFGADLLAVGWPQMAAGDHGATAREILERSHVPVLLVALAPNEMLAGAVPTGASGGPR